MEKTSKAIKFITGNKNKAIEVEQIIQRILPNINVESLKIDDIPELQGEPENIVKEKLAYARKQCPKGVILVEDTSLCFEGLKGLPGPYIKDFLEKIGREGLYKLAKGTDTTKAYAQCIFGLANNDKPEDFKIFVGRCHGDIVSPRGPTNFGWDAVFQPEGKNETYAELDKEIKNTISHRFRSLNSLVEFIKANPDYLEDSSDKNDC